LIMITTIEMLRSIQKLNQAGQAEAVSAMLDVLIQSLSASQPESKPRACAQVQRELPVSMTSKDQIYQATKKWLQQQGAGAAFSFIEIARWIDYDSGISLTTGDRARDGRSQEPWRKRLSDVLVELKRDGFIEQLPGMPKTRYLVAGLRQVNSPVSQAASCANPFAAQSAEHC
jgi:hypothetical protein